MRRWLRSPLLLLAMLSLAACSSDPDDPEARIRALLSEFEVTVESGAARDAGEFLMPDYRDPRHANRREAVATLFLYTRRHSDINLFTRVQSIELAEDDRVATAVVDVAMTGQPVVHAEDLVNLRADLYRFKIRLRWDGDQERWLIAGSEWRRAELATLFN